MPSEKPITATNSVSLSGNLRNSYDDQMTIVISALNIFKDVDVFPLLALTERMVFDAPCFHGSHYIKAGQINLIKI